MSRIMGLKLDVSSRSFLVMIGTYARSSVRRICVSSCSAGVYSLSGAMSDRGLILAMSGAETVSGLLERRELNWYVE